MERIRLSGPSGPTRPRESRPGARSRTRWSAILLVALVVVVGCGGPPAASAPPEPIRDVPVALSAHGMVVAAQPLATRVGVRTLERGGNAVDAAVATAFALSVVEPSMSGLGGRTQIIIRTSDGRTHGIDGTTQAPASYEPPEGRFRHGYPVIGVPGTVAALVGAQERFGRLPLSEVVAPAVRLARDGFRLLPGEAARHAADRDLLLESEGARMHFLKPDSSTYGAGELWVQPALARTLEAIGEEGAEVFYRGWIAERIAEDMRRNGGAVTLEALADYGAEESHVVRGSYRGHDLAGLWVPSYGAITIEILHILETLPLRQADEAEWAAAVHRAVELAYEDRGDQPDLAAAERLTSTEWARAKAAELDLPWLGGGAGTGTGGGPGSPQWTAEAAPAEDDALPTALTAAGPAGGGAEPPAWLEDPGHTTHLTTADLTGMVVALTQSNGPSMGSKVVAPGLGFLYAATLGGYLGEMEPGERARSHISPFLVLRDGEPFLALGAAGGSRIIPAVVQVVSRVVDYGYPLADALRAPRVHPTGDGIDVETGTGLGFAPASLSRLREWGYAVDEVSEPARFGRVHAVRWLADRKLWVGAADPDWEGSAGAPDEIR